MYPKFWANTKFLYEALKKEEREPLLWDKICQRTTETLKTKLGQVPTLELPELRKPFS